MESEGFIDWWLEEQFKDPEWVARREAIIEAARICRETKSWLVGNEVYNDE